jgi:diguanylate cyclase (GGDEF)-like protein
MPDPTRLLERAQTGEAAAVLAEAEEILRAETGDLADGPAAIHFVRAVCYISMGDLRAVLAAVELMLRAAEREQSPGWRACALATRASERVRLGFQDGDEYDVDAPLRDLTAAAAIVVGDADPVAAVNARVGIAVGYYYLRLYELAVPHYEAAYEISAASPDANGNRAMWLFNLAEVHLHWALELYQVGRPAEAEKHTALAEGIAERAAAEASGEDADAWRENALLMAACARADRSDPAGASVDIEYYTRMLQARGFSSSALAYSQPFRAVALKRSGRLDEALRVMEAAVAGLPPDSSWLITAATHRTHALLLAARGSADARVGLAYGDELAAALWRQRQQTLHTAETLETLSVLRAQHEEARRAADLDPLTGIANRRAFDSAVRRARSRAGTATAVIIDIDHFKQINDTSGHTAGDEALRAIARALASQLRPQDLLARLGGDEFAALLPGLPAAEAGRRAEAMVTAVRVIPGCTATVSVGVATAPAADLPATLLQADQAMYRAKRAGGDASAS